MNKKLSTISYIIFFLFFPPIVFADNYFVTVVDNLTYMVVWPIIVGLVIISFIWAGFLYLTAQGEPSKISAANKALVLGVLGIIIAILAFSAKRIIENLLGL
jgi:hypothetical protein